jgi:hypothetical protein
MLRIYVVALGAALPSAAVAEPSATAARNCAAEIAPLLADAEDKGKAIKPAAATKQQPLVCQAFRNLAAAEGKLIKYFEDHGTECRVPPDALKARKGNFAKIVEIRTKVCDSKSAQPPLLKSDELRCTPQLKGTQACEGR